MSYQTDLKIDDMPAVRKEVAEIWADLQKEAQQANVGSVIITANEVPSGDLFHQARAYNLAFTRNARRRVAYRALEVGRELSIPTLRPAGRGRCEKAPSQETPRGRVQGTRLRGQVPVA